MLLYSRRKTMCWLTVTVAHCCLSSLSLVTLHPFDGLKGWLTQILNRKLHVCSWEIRCVHGWRNRKKKTNPNKTGDDSQLSDLVRTRQEWMKERWKKWMKDRRKEGMTEKSFSVCDYFENIYNDKTSILNLTSFYGFPFCFTFIFSVPFIFLPSEIIWA